MGEKKKTGGRQPGSLNRKTIIGKSVSETLRNWLGFDDESVARTGMIDGKGYAGREKLRAMFDGQRPIDPDHVALSKFLFSYAYGHPGKMVMESGPKRDPLIFVGMTPWDPNKPVNKEMNARSARMIAEKEADEKLRALEAGKPEVIEQEPEGETLEAVIPPLPPDPSAYR